MAELATRNGYLVTASGRHVGDRTVPAMLLFGPFLACLLVGTVTGLVGSAIGAGLFVSLGGLATILLLVLAVGLQQVILHQPIQRMVIAHAHLRSGDVAGAMALCHVPLGRAFRTDVRMSAFYVLGLCAEANGDFAEADDLFERALSHVPPLGSFRSQSHARALIGAHRSIALVALHRADEAARAVGAATASLLPPSSTSASSWTERGDYTWASAQLDPDRDARALVALANVVVLAARGMAAEALAVADRERACMHAGLLPRERALLAHAEARAASALGGGPLRASAAPLAGDPAAHAWAERILPHG